MAYPDEFPPLIAGETDDDDPADLDDFLGDALVGDDEEIPE